MSASSEAPALRASLGGQAVVEGVMIRGPVGSAVCVRKPNGELACRTERSDGAHLLRGVPVLRGVFTLGETISQGMRALLWSAQVAAGREPQEPSEGHVRATSTMALALISALFLLAPAVITRRLERATGRPRLTGALEGVVRVGMLVGYLRSLGRVREAQRLFAYHGAEHRAIQAYEAGEPLEVASLRRFPNTHVRCGTSFLLTTTLVSSAIYAATGPQPTAGRRVLWRLALTPLIVGLSYEAIRIASASPNAFWAVLFRPNLALQSLTTRDPDDSQMEVALAAVQAALALHEAT